MIRLAGASLSFDGFEDVDFEQTFTLAPKTGFRNIEFNCWYPQNITNAGVKRLRRRCNDSDLTPVSLHFTGPTGVDHKDVIKDLSLGMRGIDMARELGCTTFCTLGAPRHAEGSLNALLMLVEKLIPHTEEAGITIALENHHGHALDGPDDFDEVLKRFDSPKLGVCADVGHFHASGLTSDALIDRLGDRVVHIHVKDNAELGRQQFVPFGDGTAPNVEFVAAMVDRGYSGEIVVELSPGSMNFGDHAAHLGALRHAHDMFAGFQSP